MMLFACLLLLLCFFYDRCYVRVKVASDFGNQPSLWTCLVLVSLLEQRGRIREFLSYNRPNGHCYFLFPHSKDSRELYTEECWKKVRLQDITWTHVLTVRIFSENT
jgi:hypothetical protein